MGFGEWLDRANVALGGQGPPEIKQSKAQIADAQRLGFELRKQELDREHEALFMNLYSDVAVEARAEQALDKFAQATRISADIRKRNI